MRTSLRFIATQILSLGVVSTFATSAQATVTNIAWYRLGENDPGAASGQIVNSTTVDFAGANNLRRIGSQRYTNDVSPDAAQIGSTLAVVFNGVNQLYSNAVVTTARNNFGIEAWVKVLTTADGTYVIAHNGNAATSGWGLGVEVTNRPFLGTFVAFFGELAGSTRGSGARVGFELARRAEAHVALVRDNGVSTFYVNGVAAGSTSTTNPATPAGAFAIAANPPSLNALFPGIIDEVRVFTFAPGQFSPNDLLVNQQLVTTLPASDFAPGTVTLNGRASSFGFATSVWFEWGESPSLGNMTSPQVFGSSFNTTNFREVLTGLTAGVTYHFRAVGTNNLGVAFGNIRSFSLGPFVQTLPATAIGQNAATLNGVANPRGTDTTAWFEYGFTTNYGSVTPPQALGDGFNDTNISETLTLLLADSSYHFRAVASNVFGVVVGADETFQTPPPTKNVAWYRLGENDPAAGSSRPVTNLTTDVIGTNHLRPFGSSPIYAAIFESTAKRIGTVLGINFDGSNDFLSNAVVSTIVDNFAVELWVKPVTIGSGNRVIAYNGNSALNGWGLLQTNNRYLGLLGGVTTVGLATANFAAFTHLALVRDNGVTTFYTNGVAAGTTASAPNTPAGGFAIAARPQSPLGEVFDGTVDEVRVFTFPPGHFSTNHLLVNLQRIETLPATDVATATATVHGRANPVALPSAVWFEWGPATNFSRLTVPRDIGSGVDSVDFSEALTGLNPGTLFSFRAATSNRLGVLRGTNLFFRTPGPTVATLPANPVLADLAGLIGSVNPNGISTTIWFEWGTTTNYGNITPPQSAGSGTNTVNFSEVLSELAGGTYHYRAVASNSVAVAYGVNQSFSIGPLVTTQPAGPVLGDVAGLNGTATPRGASTLAWFEWGTTTNYGNVTPAQPVGSGTNGVSFSEILNDLTAGTYHFRAVASNRLATVVGSDRTFIIGPSVATGNASPIVGDTATLNGTANANGASTTAWFEWGTTTNYGNFTPLKALGSGTTNVSFSETVPDLTAGVYHFRAVASNRLAIVFGLDRSFIIGPLVQTLAAVASNTSSATLNGAVNPRGTSASAWFEWGMTTNYDNFTPIQLLGSGTTNVKFSEPLTGLSISNTYHFRAVASNTVGVVFGADRSFSTLFTDSGVTLTGVESGSAAWGDYDNDGRLDILLTGRSRPTPTNSVNVAEVWRNTGNGFSNINAGLLGVNLSFADWGDYDNDGRLDILLTGFPSTGTNTTQLWRNRGSTFEEISTALPGIARSSVAWGDYDNDGLLDILLSGQKFPPLVRLSQVWRNTGNGFVDINAGLPSLSSSSAAWGDYDNDGRLDILLSGFDGTNNFAQVWRNTGSGFVDVNAGLPGLSSGSAAWGDYDNDGQLDILLTGSDGTNRFAQVWRNNGSGFEDINAGLPGVSLSSAAWGDYDNDGRLDILLAGTTVGGGLICEVWRNTGSGFENVDAALPGITSGAAAWGDYDNDGRLDILVAGTTDLSELIARVFRNNTPLTNTSPSAPTDLQVSFAGGIATLTWNAANDAQTSASGLSYNMRVETVVGAANIIGPMASISGQRRVPRIGNSQMRQFLHLKGLPSGATIFWSVQAVDSAFAGGPFATNASFTLGPLLNIAASGTSVTISWTPSTPVFVLQESLDLSANAWSNSPSGANNPITIPVAEPNKFFRLFKP